MDNTIVRTYRYGLLAPTENGGIVREQMRRAHIYRNTLTEIEQGRRAAVRDAISSHPEIMVLEQTLHAASEEVEKALKAYKNNKSATGKRTVDPSFKKALDAAKSVKKTVTKKLKEAQQKLRDDPKVTLRLDQIYMVSGELVRNARAHSKTYWGTYQLVERAIQAAKAVPLYDTDGQPNDPRFVPWKGEGAVGVQVVDNLLCENVFSHNTIVYVDPTDERAWYSEKRSERRKMSRTVLHMRVSSKDDRKPIFASWPMVMHRPLPKNGVITNVVVHVQRIGPREEWSVVFTVKQEQCLLGRPKDGAVAVDIGWRRTGKDLLVATWVGDDGEEGQLLLSEDDLRAFHKAEELKSIRDRAFDAERARLGGWLNSHQLPDWLRERTKYLIQWKSQARLAVLAKIWKNQRFEGDEEGYELLEKWRYHDYHLWAWESSQRIGALRRRKQIYRCFAKALTNKYRTVVFEDFDLRKVAEKPDTGIAPGDNETARSNRQLAAPSRLVESIKNVATELKKLPPQYTTVTCHACGVVTSFPAATMVYNKCSSCGVMWHQDINACKNLLALYVAQKNNPDADDTKEKAKKSEKVKELRWVRVKRLQAEREARMKNAQNQEEHG